MNKNMVMDTLNWLVTLSNTVMKEHIGEHLKQRMPGFLGLSLADEEIFAFIRSRLSKKRDVSLGKFLLSCKDYERSHFRRVVSGIPTEEKITSTGSGKKKKETKELSYKPAISFLNRIAILTEELGPEEAYQLCLSGGVIVENPIHIKALKAWRDGVSWFKTFFLDKLGVASIAEITPELLNEKFGDLIDSLEESVADPILKPVEDYIKTEKSKGFLGLFTI